MSYAKFSFQYKESACKMLVKLTPSVLGFRLYFDKITEMLIIGSLLTCAIFCLVGCAIIAKKCLKLKTKPPCQLKLVQIDDTLGRRQSPGPLEWMLG